MKPIVLVLFIATSAFAAPSVTISQYSSNEIAPAKDNGKLVSSYLTERAFDLIDGGDTNIHILNVEQIIKDLANSGDKSSQALALAQTIAIVSELASGIPGDACASSDLINAYVAGSRSGNFSGFRTALNNYVKLLGSNLKRISKLASDPNSLRYSAGSTGGCQGGGRTYDFEDAWQLILASSNSALLNEQYCVAKRLYYAFNVRSNNVGARLTASSIIAQVFEPLIPQAANFLRVIAQRGNASQAASELRSALVDAASRFRV